MSKLPSAVAAPATPSLLTPPRDVRLDSWKEIAAYLRRDVSTVQRWEKREGMPVHRHVHDKAGSVSALATELDAWLHGRTASSTTGNDTGNAREAIPKNPFANAQFTPVTDFDGAPHAATVSRDGKFVAFLSKLDGRTDVWITQIGSGGGRFYNLTRGAAPDLVNHDIRTLLFSPDGTLVLFWARTSGPTAGHVGIWSVPTLGGDPRPYLDDVPELDWSDSGRLVYHTAAPGDPMYVTGRNESPPGNRIFAESPGRHAHFPVWSPDEAFIYFVGGIVPNELDIWRIEPLGGAAERLTFHDSRVGHPVFLNRRMLLYLATGADGSGPWLHALDTERRVAHRIGSGVDRYTSLSISGDRKRLVATRSSPKAELWRADLSEAPTSPPNATRMRLPTGSGRSPRFGPGYLLYVSSTGTSDSLWKFANGAAAELWSAPAGAKMLGGPAVSADGGCIAISVSERGQSRLYVMNADGTHARVVADSLALRGAPAWAPDGRSLLVTAADAAGTPCVHSVSLDGRTPTPMLSRYSVDPTCAPDGSYFVYSGPDVGTTFEVKAATLDGRPHHMPNLVLTRGARHVAFLPDRSALIVLKGEIGHKDIWMIDLETGSERPLTNFGRDVIVRDFDISPDGRELVFEQVQEHSDIVRIDLAAQ